MTHRLPLAAALACLLPSLAFAATPVPPGNLIGTSPVTWTLAGSPYELTGDVTIPAGTVLNIEAGVAVRAKRGDALGAGEGTTRTELRVAGTLNANGLPASRVTFGSGETTPAIGDWYGIVALAGGSVNLSGTDVSHGFRGVYAKGSTGNTLTGSSVQSCNDGVYVDAAGSVAMTNVELANNANQGAIVISGAASTWSYLRVHHNAGYGLDVQNTTLTLTDSQIVDNGSYGINVYKGNSSSYTVTLRKNTVVGNGGTGIYAYTSYSSGTLSVPVTNSIVSSNGSYGIRSSGYASTSSSYNVVWGQATNHDGLSPAASVLVENPLFVALASRDLRITSNSPARKHASDASDIGALPYDGVATVGVQGHLYVDTTWSGTMNVLGDVTVEPGVTLTVQPGTTVHFAANADSMGGNANTARSELRVLGILAVSGNASSPVLFDASGASSPAWAGVFLLPTSGASLLDYLTIREADTGLTSTAPSPARVAHSILERNGVGVSVTSGAVALDSLTVRNNSGDGVYVSAANPTLSNSLVVDNAGYGVNVYKGNSSTYTVALSKNTVVGNGGTGIYAYTSYSSGTLSVPVTNSIVSGNGSYGIRSSGYASASSSYNLVWGQTSNHDGLSPAGSVLSENPLFVALASRDLRITSNSPARKHASDASDIGALPYDGTATVGVQGHLYVDTTWSGTMNVLGDVTVEPGVTLTVQPGTTVHFAANADSMGGNANTARSELRVLGTLAVSGNASSPVLFDASGASSPAWAGVFLLPTSGASLLDYLTIREADTGLTSTAPSPARVAHSILERNGVGVSVTSGAVALDSLTVRNNSGDGVYVSAANPTLSNSLVVDNAGYGVNVYKGNSSTYTVALSKNTVVGNGGTGIYAYTSYSSGTLSVPVTNSIVSSNGSYGIRSSGYASASSSYNLVWGQTSNHDGLSPAASVISENPLFVALASRDLRITSNSPARKHASDSSDIGALPYDGTATGFLAGHLYENLTLTPSGSPYLVTGDLTVEPGIVLTIQPNVTVLFAAKSDVMGGNANTTRTELRVRGTLLSDATASSGIVLQSNAASPATDDWYGIDFMSGSVNSLLDYTTVRHATTGLGFSGGAATAQRSTIERNGTGVSVTSGAPTLTLLTVRNNTGDGVYVSAASPTLSNSLVVDNAGYGVNVYKGNSSTYTVALSKNTVVGNGGAGIYAYTSYSSGTLSVPVTNSIVSSNGSYGIRSSGYASASSSYNLVWGQTTNHDGLSPAASVLSENPLFVALASRDLRITSNSPARKHASDSSDIGALAYDGAPTVGVQGHYYVDTTWSGTVNVLGDITVEPGITLTVADGAQIRMAKQADSMGGNASTSRTELRVLGTLNVQGTASGRVQFVSDSATQVRGDWHGIWLAPSGTGTLFGLALQHAYNGVHSQAATATLSRAEISACSGHGVYVQSGGLVVDAVKLHHNDGYGVQVNAGTPAFRNLAVWANGGRGISFETGSAACTASVQHSTVVGNGGTGVYLYRSSSTGSTSVTLANSLVVSNGSYGVQVSGYATGTLRYNDVFGQSTNLSGVSGGTGALSVAPLFVDEAAGNFHLQPSSPCIDAGDPASTVVSDLEGVVRPIDGGGSAAAVVDMGAYEYNPIANKWPVANAGPDKTVTSGLSASFDGTASSDPDGTLVDYAWDFGDGSPVAHGATVSHTFAGGTDRTVTLTVTDNNGATASDTASVKVNLPPIANAGPDTFEDANTVVLFSSTGSSDPDGSITSYVWDFGDGTPTASGSSVSHTYTKGGDYTVTLTVTDNDGATGTDTAIAHILGPVDNLAPTITHTPIANGQSEGIAVAISATVTDATGVGAVSLYYRTEGAPTFTKIAMVAGAADSYTATIPAGTVAMPAVQYYLEATDTASPSNTGTSPSSAPGTPHRFTVKDANGPVIAHTKVADGQTEGQAVTVTATASDGSGVLGLRLYYRTAPSGAFASTSMTLAAGTWTAQIPAATVKLAGVHYYLTATDTASPANTSTEPAGAPTAFHAFTVVDRTGPAISHSAVPNGQTANTAVAVTAVVTDVSGVASVSLYYRTEGSPTYTKVALTGSGSSYSGSIPAPAVDMPAVQYYLEAVDSAGTPNTSVNPSTAPGTPHRFTVKDASGPVITHTPVANDRPEDQPVTVSATVTDGTGVGSVTLYYRTQGAATFSTLAMTASGSTYTASIPAATVRLPAVQYYLSATDSASPANSATHPAGAPASFHTFTVADRTAPVVTHTPVAANRPLGQAVTVTATVTDATGVGSVGLYYRKQGAAGFTLVSMTLAAGTWSGTIPATAVQQPAVEYYLEAADTVTPANTATHPAGGAAAPLSFTVSDQTGPVISHTAVPDGQQANQPVTVTATVTDDVAVGSVILHYRTQGTTTFSPLALSATGSSYSGQIPAAAVKAPGVEYYLEAEDGSSNVTVDPVGAPLALHAFTVTAGDTAAPSMTHTPIADGRSDGQAVAISATITDASGVGSAKVYYRARGTGAFTSAALTGAGSTWTGSIPASAVKVPGVDYYLEATDQAGTPNTGTAPAGGAAAPFTFTVVVADTTAPVVVHTPVAAGRPEGQAVTVAATVTDDVGVTSVTVSYRATGTATFTTTAMVKGTGNDWSASIPGAAVTPAGVEYYVEAKDAAGNAATSPAGAPASFHAFTVLPAVQLKAGDLLVTEIMNNPSGTETDREWFEVYNATEAAIDLQGLTFSDTGTNTFTVTGSVVVQAKAYAVLARTDDKAKNGNVTVHYAYGSKMSLANSSDEIIVKAGTVELDRVAYGAGFPATTDGKAMSLEPTAMTLAGNDVASAWCLAKAQIAGGTDFGTPGAANDPCIVPDTQPPAIVHTPVTDGQQAGTAVAIHAVVTDDSGLASVTLAYRVTGTTPFTEVPMTAGPANGWSATIPAAAVTTAGVDYYLTAVDKAPAANGAIAPTTAPATPYDFSVTTTDTSGPSITHTPQEATVLAGATVALQALITDASGIASATVHYRTGTGAWASLPMTAGTGGSYSATLPAAAIGAPSVSYYLRAVDAAPDANASTLPAAGETAPFTFTVKPDDRTAPAITHVPVGNDQIAGRDVAVKATVTDDTGVASVHAFYRVTGAPDWRKVALAASGQPNEFAASLPGLDMAKPTVEYYLEAVDTSDQMNVGRSPAGAPTTFHLFTVIDAASDVTPPDIAHTPVADGVPAGEPVVVSATVTDPSGVASVELRYRVRGTPDFTTVAMTGVSSVYTGTIPAQAVTAAGVEYFLRAEDQAPAQNAGTHPQEAPAKVHAFVPEGGSSDAGTPGADAGLQADAGEVVVSESGCGCGATGAPASALGGLLLVMLGLARRRRP